MPIPLARGPRRSRPGLSGFTPGAAPGTPGSVVSGPEIFVNGWATTLAAPLAATDQIIQLTAPLPAQQGGQVRLNVTDAAQDNTEWVLAGTTPVASNTYPVVRGVDGSSPVDHNAGDAVTAVLTVQAIGGQADGAPNVPTLRSLGTGANQAAPGSALAGISVVSQPLGPVASLTDPKWGAKGNGSYVAQSSGTSMSGTDDTAAITAALWSLNYTGGTLLLGPYTYYVNSPPQTIGMGNAVIPFPTFGWTPASLAAIGANIPFEKPTIRVQGVPGLTKIICPRTDAWGSTNGPMSVMGGPTKEGVLGAGLNLANGIIALPARWETQDTTFIGPDAPVGGLVDKGALTSARTINCQFFTTATTNFENGGVKPVNLPGIASFGLRNPTSGGMESRSLVQECLFDGYGALIITGSHSVIVDCVENYGRAMIAIDDGAVRNAPMAVIHYLWATGTNYWITGWDAQNGVKALTTAISTAPAIIRGIIGQDPWAAPFAPTAFALDTNSLIGGMVETYGWPNILAYGAGPFLSGKSTLLTSRSLDQSGHTGTATLSAGTVTVTTGAAAFALTSSNIRCGARTAGGTPGAIWATCTVNGTVVIKSTSASDTSVVWYDVGNPE